MPTIVLPICGSNLFRLHPAGSRQNKILLNQPLGVPDETARLTVKKYTRQEVYGGDGERRHERIRLEPLHPEFDAWDAEQNAFAVVAERPRVIE
ncbi:MAG TPA: hypothetical protein VKB88_24325 [Bryobacteraceae bacterium]|nr:hypothetical protein [Bryobacteraceae bacterium]